MKKILEFANKHHIFLAYDHELATIPDIRLINVRNSIVTFAESSSDINDNFFNSEKPWEECKQKTLNTLPNLFGWYEDKQIHKMMDSIKKKKPKLCVEIGSFGGILTYSIASSLHFLKEGTLYAIDAWNADIAAQGIQGEKTLQWWKSLDMNGLYEKFCTFFASGPLKRYVHPLRKTSKEVVSSFADGSIDFLVLDGNPSAEQSLEDTLLYFPKVKEGGYIWVQNAQLDSKNTSVEFLFRHCHWVEEESSVAYVLFEKKK
jgi:predicted O-methyltransferase YrrM